MARVELVAIIFVALLFGLLFWPFPSAPHTQSSPPTVTATSTTAFATPTPLPHPTIVFHDSAESATSSAHKAPKPPLLTAPVMAPMAPPPPAVSQAALDAAAAKLRAALVNILCFAPAGSPIHSISASGVIVSANGYILTNAHVAQYFLLFDQGVSCTARAGDPAADAYKARLAYIPAAWVNDNASVITQAAPSGTGERDFAVLAITGSLSKASLPISFPAAPLAFAVAPAATPVVIGSYGAQFLQFSEIEHSLSPTVVFGSVGKLFTFGTSTADVMSISGSAAAQEGSSGGGVIDGDGDVVGAITTSTVEGDTSGRTLSAITAAYVRREYDAETGESIDGLFAEAPAQAAMYFAPHIHDLEAKLLAAFAAR